MTKKECVKRKVQKIVDGDTFKVSRNVNDSQYIRVAGLNAPEKGQRGYDAAKRKLSRQINNKNVTICPKAKSYGRTVAKVTFNGKDIAKS